MKNEYKSKLRNLKIVFFKLQLKLQIKNQKRRRALMFRKRKMLSLMLVVAILIQVILIGVITNTSKSATKGTSTSKTFTAWWGLYSPSAAKYTNSDLSTVLAWQEFFKRTGIKIKFIHPPVGQESESFKLMIASDEIPDMIFCMISSQGFNPSYPGGWDKAIEDKVIIRLNSLIDKYMPNLKKIIQSDSGIRKDITSDKGNMYFIPNIQMNWYPWGGMQVRKDWLDELGLKEPVTYDDWYKMLKVFKQKKGAVMQLLSIGYHMYEVFTAGFGVGTSFCQVNGKVKYGPLESGFLQYLTMMNKWYKEGLIDKDFYANRQYFPDENSIIRGKYGAWMGPWQRKYYKMISKDPKFDVVAVPAPVKKKGDKIHLGKLTWRNKIVDIIGLTITTRCKDPVSVAKAFDYLYSKEGQILRSYGIVNKTFTYVKGKPQYTKLITSIADNAYRWKYLLFAAPGIKDCWASDVEANPLVDKEEAREVYRSKWATSDMAWELPDWLTLTQEEGQKVSQIMSDVNTFVQETIPKFIIGQMPLSKYNSFVSKLKSLKIEEAIKIYQNAYNRYLKR